MYLGVIYVKSLYMRARDAWYDLAQDREPWRKLIAKQFTEKQ